MAWHGSTVRQGRRLRKLTRAGPVLVTLVRLVSIARPLFKNKRAVIRLAVTVCAQHCKMTGKMIDRL